MDGIDVSKVTSWFDRNLGGVTPPLHFELLAGGRSNLTYKVTDATERSCVLRRPPLGHVLPAAVHVVVPAIHDTYELLSAGIPDQQAAAVVPGDDRLDNCLLGLGALDGTHTRCARAGMGADGAGWPTSGESVVALADATRAMADRAA